MVHRIVRLVLLASAWLGVAPQATAQDSGAPNVPNEEATLISAFLNSPALTAALDAAAARTAAASVAIVDLTNPEVAYRHEDARGEAGARTDAVVGTVTVDLGFVAAGERRAARQRGEAGALWTRNELSGAVCGLRRDLGELAFSDRESAVRRTAQRRLEVLGSSLLQLAEAGEASGYDRDRTLLAVSSHRIALATSDGAAQGRRNTLSARLGVPLGTVELAAPVEPPPSDALVEQALASHPELLALRLEQKAARTAESAARRTAAPDLTLSGGARFDAPPERGPATPGFEVGVAIELPLFSTGKAEAYRAESARAQVTAELAQREAEIAADVSSAWSRLATARSLGGLGADPEVVWAAAQERFSGGEASIDELLQTARDVEEAQLGALAAGRMLRAAYVDVWCATATHPEPGIAQAIEESLR